MLRNSVVSQSRRGGIRLLIVGLLFTVSACVPDFLVKDPEWVVIEKGMHEPVLKRKGGMLISPREVSATVKFDSSCMYDVTQVDEFDYNKVFGLGFVGSENQHMGQAPHQVDGARVAWRWNPKQNRIDLGAYVYVEGKRITQDLGSMKINEERRLSIKIDYENRTYQVLDGEPIPFTHKKTIAYRNGLYFGGNQPAPQTIRVMIK
ncbi:hypothetical protein [Rudanella lutea]|uniref:hypothetical protein n=1 Tax=Rudanella lutea TaxID=451374 RepID=UPI00037F4F44|nr:hypothetical protein [Rudanella lutea]